MDRPEVKPPWTNDQLLASAVRFLIDGQEEIAARLLLSCTLQVAFIGTRWLKIEDTDFGIHHYFSVKLKAPRLVYDVLVKERHPMALGIQSALQAVLPHAGPSGPSVDDFGDPISLDYPAYIERLVVTAELVNIDPGWRTELLEIARGEGVHNQGGGASSPKELRTWQNLRFRSMSEIRIAEALDRASVLFFPNCLGRLNSPQGRRNREPDFLICINGKWGILEVDGEPFHPPSRTTEDHDRDRSFKGHGIRVVEHYDATRCYEHPDSIVREFLDLMQRSS